MFVLIGIEYLVKKKQAEPKPTETEVQSEVS